MTLSSTSINPLISGATAGVFVDVSLYPLDTLKTRLQSEKGFRSAGGFRSLYSGLPSILLGSAPNAAIFFFSYESMKRMFVNHSTVIKSEIPQHIISASFGEIMACLIRVPSEVIKQRVQAKQHSSVKQAIRFCYKENGFSSFYRGFFITIFRDVPFAMIQYPLWEYFKQVFQSQSPTYNALCGSMAGAIAAAITTPLDVIKTQIMLNKSRKTKGIGTTSLRIYNQHGPTKFFSGVLPRVSWMSLGGYIYFGVYEYMKRMQFEKMK